MLSLIGFSEISVTHRAGISIAALLTVRRPQHPSASDLSRNTIDPRRGGKATPSGARRAGGGSCASGARTRVIGTDERNDARRDL